MREECVSSWVSDSFVHMSSLSHRQLGWKSAYGLAAYGLYVYSDWSVALSMQELSATVKSQMLTNVDEKLCQMSNGRRSWYVQKQ